MPSLKAEAEEEAAVVEVRAVGGQMQAVVLEVPAAAALAPVRAAARKARADRAVAVRVRAHTAVPQLARQPLEAPPAAEAQEGQVRGDDGGYGYGETVICRADPCGRPLAVGRTSYQPGGHTVRAYSIY